MKLPREILTVCRTAGVDPERVTEYRIEDGINYERPKVTLKLAPDADSILIDFAAEAC